MQTSLLTVSASALWMLGHLQLAARIGNLDLTCACQRTLTIRRRYPIVVPNDLAVDQPQRGRIHYLDNLKAILIILVIFHHAGQPYGPGGGWPIQDSPKTPLLGPYFWLQASFFMGLMFFVSAYFVPRSLGRKGAATFLKDRLVRLGIPVALFALVRLLPLLASYIGLMDKPSAWAGFSWQYMPLGHLWFVEHLLVYSALYVLPCFLVPPAA